MLSTHSLLAQGCTGILKHLLPTFGSSLHQEKVADVSCEAPAGLLVRFLSREGALLRGGSGERVERAGSPGKVCVPCAQGHRGAGPGLHLAGVSLASAGAQAEDPEDIEGPPPQGPRPTCRSR